MRSPRFPEIPFATQASIVFCSKFKISRLPPKNRLNEPSADFPKLHFLQKLDTNYYNRYQGQYHSGSTPDPEIPENSIFTTWSIQKFKSLKMSQFALKIHSTRFHFLQRGNMDVKSITVFSSRQYKSCCS